MYVFKEFVEGVVAWEHEGVGHSYDGFSVESAGAGGGVAGDLHFFGCFSVVEEFGYYALFHEESAFAWDAFFVVEVMSVAVF